MDLTRTSGLLLAGLCCLGATAQADDSVMTLGNVTINGTDDTGAAPSAPLSTRNVLSSVDVLGSDVIKDAPVTYSWELFRRAPGVLLTEFGQGTTSGKISMRGFNGEGEINAVKLLIDGIPSNSNDGNMPFMDMIFPLEIDDIEVVRGTSDPRYGLNNIAGNVDIHTRTGGNYNTARWRYGSHDTREFQLAKGIETANWSQNYFFGWQKSEGWRDHAASERYTLGGKWFYTADDDSYRVGLIARHYEAAADEPGYLSNAQAGDHTHLSNPWNADDQGTRRMNTLSLHLDQTLTDTLSSSSKLYWNQFDDRRWTRYWVTSSQQERDAYENQYGALSSLTWRPEQSWLNDFSLEGGLEVQRQDNTSERYSTIARVRQTQTRDQDFTLNNYGAYVQAVIQPFESLKIIPAYRVDRLTGDFDNGLTGGHYSINDYGVIRQPKLSVVYSPVRQLSLYANWGRTFQVGTGASAYKVPPRTTDLDPSVNQGWETGIKFTPADWLDGRLAYWRQDASGEVSRNLNDPDGDSENVGKTRRWGYDLQLNLHPTERLDAWLSYSWQYSKILEPSSTLPDSKGKEIDHVPHHLYSAGTRYRVTPTVELSAWMNGQTDYYLERENTQGRYGGYVLMNLGATWHVTSTVSLDLQLKNLANRYYEYVWYDSDGALAPLHAPGEGRSLYGGLTWDF